MNIIDYPNYTIDRDGIVKNKTTGKILKNPVNLVGYKVVPLYNDEGKKLFTIHRLLGLHYIPNPENKPCIDHIDRNRLNNDLSNLRWATHSENSINSTPMKRDLPINIWKRYNRYHVDITRNGVRVRLGSYATIEEAIAIRDSY